MSIDTSTLDTFIFNWNGTNTTLRAINCSENTSYIGALGGFCIDQYEVSVPGCDASPGSNCASYTSAGYCNASLCVPVSGVFGAVGSDTGTTVNATSQAGRGSVGWCFAAAGEADVRECRKTFMHQQ